MKRREFIKSVGVTATAIALSRFGFGAQEQRRKPNIIFILIDDLGWRDLGCYGNRFHETPNIDRLAREGMLFTDAYATAPVCSPTRASILTGKYPARLGITDFIPGHQRPWAKLRVPPNLHQLPLEEVTIAEALKRAGYVSASFGKWHLGGRKFFPDRQGFDTWVVTSGGHFYPHFKTTPKMKIHQGAYLADVLTDWAEAFIEQNRSRPFFLYLAHYAVHIPLQARKELIDKYRSKPKPEGGINNPVYAAMVEHVDHSVGRLLRKLDELNIADCTLVIFTSDNGGLRQRFDGQGPLVTTNAPLRAEKGTLYEGGIRVPLIVRWRSVIKPNSVCHVPVCSADFYPTILEVAGLEEEITPNIDGESLMPLFMGTGGLKRNALYWHYPHYHHSSPAGAIREGDFKLIEFYEDEHLELYNLREDISEQSNLANRMPSKATELREKLTAWRKAIGAKMPMPNPDYDPARAHEWARR